MCRERPPRQRGGRQRIAEPLNCAVRRRPPMRSKRLGRALLLAPLAAPLVVVFCVLPYELVSRSVGEDLGIALLFGVVATAISYILTILLGLPTHWFLQRRRLVRGRHYGLAGLFLGAMSFLVPLGIRRTQMRIAAGASFFDLPYGTGGGIQA